MIKRYISLIFYLCHHSESDIRIYRVSVNTAAVFKQYPQVFMHGEFTWGNVMKTWKFAWPGEGWSHARVVWDKDISEFVYNLTCNRPKTTSESLSTLTPLYAENPYAGKLHHTGSWCKVLMFALKKSKLCIMTLCVMKLPSHMPRQTYV